MVSLPFFIFWIFGHFEVFFVSQWLHKFETPKFLGQFHTSVFSNVSQYLNHQNRKPTGRDISPRYARKGKLRGTQAYLPTSYLTSKSIQNHANSDNNLTQALTIQQAEYLIMMSPMSDVHLEWGQSGGYSLILGFVCKKRPKSGMMRQLTWIFLH